MKKLLLTLALLSIAGVEANNWIHGISQDTKDQAQIHNTFNDEPHKVEVREYEARQSGSKRANRSKTVRNQRNENKKAKKEARRKEARRNEKRASFVENDYKLEAADTTATSNNWLLPNSHNNIQHSTRGGNSIW